jgi:hypothetical protein
MGPDFSFMDDRVQCHANLMRLAMKHPDFSLYWNRRYC